MLRAGSFKDILCSPVFTVRAAQLIFTWARYTTPSDSCFAPWNMEGPLHLSWRKEKNIIPIIQTTSWTSGPFGIPDPIYNYCRLKSFFNSLVDIATVITIDLHQHCHHYDSVRLSSTHHSPKHTWTRIGQKNVPATMAAHHRAGPGVPWVDITEDWSPSWGKNEQTFDQPSSLQYLDLVFERKSLLHIVDIMNDLSYCKSIRTHM